MAAGRRSEGRAGKDLWAWLLPSRAQVSSLSPGGQHPPSSRSSSHLWPEGALADHGGGAAATGLRGVEGTWVCPCVLPAMLARAFCGRVHTQTISRRPFLEGSFCPQRSHRDRLDHHGCRSFFKSRLPTLLSTHPGSISSSSNLSSRKHLSQLSLSRAWGHAGNPALPSGVQV